ncbi:hypothetical protein [Burkholderia cenocepacia]|uniref:hypothetical protein n=1 Tax=Burkholderia cenocepacia TaxID=95486 RepID=UPI001B9FC251|nr:hypothetical protein [Burkholderia cenocepacia]MBR7945426.1 hypothetical protein [Burkholderia cenocepacia]
MDRKLNLLRQARDRGVNLRGVAVTMLLSAAVALLAVDAVLLAWHGLLPSMYVLAALPLVLGAVMLVSSDIGLTNEERLDRHLGLSFRGEHRAVCTKAYDDLWRIDEVDVRRKPASPSK